MVFSRKFRRFYFFEQYISSRFFENEPNEICSHFSEKGPKAAFFILRPRSSKITPAKEKERRKKRAKRRKVGDEKKAMVTLLVFIVATLAIVFSRKKNCLTEEDCLAVKHFQKSG